MEYVGNFASTKPLKGSLLLLKNCELCESGSGHRTQPQNQIAVSLVESLRRFSLIFIASASSPNAWKAAHAEVFVSTLPEGAEYF
jgi:hypothetical protein